VSNGDLKWENTIMDINKRFGLKLRELRAKKKLTQEKLADLAGIDYKYVQMLEGKTPPSPTLNSIEKIAKGLKIRISKLINFQ
jgi:transcriptional regulator with XRE-family HTH domain